MPIETMNDTDSIGDQESYEKLLEAGLSPTVAKALDKVFQEDLVQFSDLDQRAIDALKELDDAGAVAVLKQFNDSNLLHVHNKSAFLCGVMKIYRQRQKAERDGFVNGCDIKKHVPSEEKIKELLDRTNYSLDVTTGQRRYGGPPPKDVYDGDEPGAGCQVFIGRIPRTVFEDELIPLLEKAGTIWDFRLMMDPLNGQNRGYGFATYTTKQAAVECVKQLDNYEILPKKYLGVCVSQSNCRLFVGSIPKTKTKSEIFEEFDAITQGLKDVILYLQTEDKNKNRGFCFLEYIDHKSASQARRRLSSNKLKVFNNSISVDWADPIEEPSDEIMAKVKVLYVKNLSVKATEEVVMQTFCVYGDVERVKKIKDYAFVHFKERENALKALEELNGLNLEGEPIEISLAKPVDKKKRERQMERKMMNQNFMGMRMPFGPGLHGRGGRMGYGRPAPFVGYGGYNDDYFTGDYIGYGFGGFDDPFFMSMQRSFRNQRGGPRNMYGNGNGYMRQNGNFGRGGKPRGRGGPGNYGMGGRGRPNMSGKRDYVMVMS